MTAERSEDSLPGIIYGLRALAGVGLEIDDFNVTDDGVTMRVKYVGGSSSSIELSIPYDAAATQKTRETARPETFRDGRELAAIRPMMIRLTPEESSHVEGKASGVDVEHQTGDEPFDQRVYIDAPDVRPIGPIFANSDLRAAVLDLFVLGFNNIVIDNEKNLVVASCHSFSSVDAKIAPAQTLGARAANGFARLAKNLPAVRAAAGTHPTDPLKFPSRVVLVLSALLFFLTPPLYFFFSADKTCVEGGPAAPCAIPALVGLTIGAVAGFAFHLLLRGPLRRSYGGTSSSSTRITEISTGFGFILFWIVADVIAFIIARYVYYPSPLR